MQKAGRLELTWVGKYDDKVVEPRILIEDTSKSYGDASSENMLIHGDNLIALQALQQDFAGRIKCIYIDPPYNTGAAFEQYDDNLEHSIWLSLMRNRLKLLKDLLSEDGTIWISIDDDEQAYLKVLCDEIFMRQNFVANVIWEKKFSPQNDARWLSDSHDFILVYAKNKEVWKPNLLPRTQEMDDRYKNPDNDPRGPWTSSDFTARTYSATTDYPIKTPSGRIVTPTKSRSWISTKDEFERLVEDNRIWFGAKGNNVPRKKTFLSEVKGGSVPMTIWKYDDVGSTQDAKKEVKDVNPDNPFATPKPEKLVERILSIATNEGDLILDSFLGSGTTVAVAHKMKRKWIGIELGEQAYDQCKRRMDRIVDGVDRIGVTEKYSWQGGGGYHFYELAPSLLVKNDKLPIYQINPEYTFEMICEAICKIEGFHYKPQECFHGYSSEKRFIHITMEFINAEYIKSLSMRLAEGQSLLVYGTKIQSDMILPDNIDIKKIPKDLLEKCVFESEVR
ncbi:MAG: site-specific DNA-methyltransferase [Lachnospiraceae bacterium]|nr:site-specific DNA-methyltransferase [Lachnospiraceae bacterium]